MGHGVKVQGYTDACGKFAFNFLQNYTVNMFENYYCNSQVDCEQESTEPTGKPIKGKCL